MISKLRKRILKTIIDFSKHLPEHSFYQDQLGKKVFDISYKTRYKSNMTSDNFNDLLQFIRTKMSELEEMSARGEEDRIKEIVSLRVKAYRLEHNLTQSELAIQLGVDRMQIIRWESGKHKPGKLALRMLKEKKIIPEIK